MGLADFDPFNSNPNPETEEASTANQSPQLKPPVVATNPSPLENATILPTQTVEITFSKPLVNDPARVVIDPNHKIRVELSPDHKRMKIVPVKPYILGTTYTLTIKKDYGFDTGDKLEEDITFHFKTIDYSGV